MNAARVPTVNFRPLKAQRQALTSTKPIVMYSGGIGSGKSFTGAFWCGMRPAGSKVLVVAPSYRILRDGTIPTLERIFPWGKKNESKMTFTLPNGTVLLLRSAKKLAESVKSVEPTDLWLEEAAYIPREAIHIAMGRLRASKTALIFATTNPKKGAAVWNMWVKEPLDDVCLVSAKTADNPAISRRLIRQLRRDYGERLAAQELDGEWIDVTGGLWDAIPYGDPPERFRNVVIGVDPSVGGRGEIGIIAAGEDYTGHVWIIDDASGHYGAHEWPKIVCDLARVHNARVVAEVNNGGDLVERVVRTQDPATRYEAVRAGKDKEHRAQPIAIAYRQGKVSHAGIFPRLEAQMLSWEPNSNDDSPDRLDALVWATHSLGVGTGVAAPGPWTSARVHDESNGPVTITAGPANVRAAKRKAANASPRM